MIRAHFGSHDPVAFKGAVNPVTATDTAAEEIIRSRLRAAFPDHRILGEESGEEGRAIDADGVSAPKWFVDPLDGTNNFAHSIPHFSVSLGLRSGGRTQVGVVYDPMRDNTFAAYQGGGTMLDGAAVHVSNVEILSGAFLASGFPYTRRTAADNNTRMLDYFLRRSQGVRRAGSAALDMAYVACGRFDGYWEPKLSPWDITAGLLLVEEAGGRISDFGGERTRLFSGDEVLVSNGLIHDEMLAVLHEGAAAPHPDFPSLTD